MTPNPQLSHSEWSCHGFLSVRARTFFTMVCLVCSRAGAATLCDRCRNQLVPAGLRRLSGGLLVGSGFVHDGPARVLVHRLKYQGIVQAAGPLAERMAELLDGRAGILVPVTRAVLRTWRYGVDPGRELTRALSAITGRRQVDVLVRPLWAAGHAGVGRAGRTSIRFEARPLPPGPLILIDDVLTTGATLSAARRAVGESAISGVTATSAGRVVL